MKAQLRKAIPVMFALFTLNAAAVTRYVDLNSPSAAPPYTNWLTAATNIQDAVAVALPGDTVLVTNGVYSFGGAVVYGVMTNRVALTNQITLLSANGPQSTVIAGGVSTRGAYVGSNSILSGFTLAFGRTATTGDAITERSGGGAWCHSSGLLTNCIVISNEVPVVYYGGGVYGGMLRNCRITLNKANKGGGTYGAALENCLLATNTSGADGGGAALSFLTNCAIWSNQALDGAGGGAYRSLLVNCSVISNYSSRGGGGVAFSTNYSCIIHDNQTVDFLPPGSSNWYSGRFENVCTSPLPAGAGNTASPPVLVGQTPDDFHLAANSPCINAGKNSYAPTGFDLDGELRIVGGTVDMGAYEFQSPSSVLSYAWAQQYSLPTDGSADYLDNDGDSHNNWQEWRADTIPTNAFSVLRIVNVTDGALGLNVTWQSVSTRSYFLERATNFSDVSPFQGIATSIPGASGSKTYTDTSATNGGPYFYRVGVQ